ncbi:MAG: hypothetical protein JNL18_19290 [Planctomycetaceae bacterium]|nr:hypothetical protein [Planctomycetaceae bacterium]
MTSTRRKHWTLFLTWLIATPIACAVGMGVSAFVHRYIESTRGPGEGHILPLVIAVISTATFISLTFRIR